MQGRSLGPLLSGATPGDWRTAMYYRYWLHHDVEHHVWAHYGIRTDRHKLIYYYAEPCGQPGAYDVPRTPEWELFDLERDPLELHSVYDDPAYSGIVTSLREQLRDLQEALGDTECAPVPSAD
jgi:arylsulfatase A-like enzyme